ncbi:MAG: hypothetical protein AB8B72_01720 [Crocinitomicaceae bacterium]
MMQSIPYLFTKPCAYGAQLTTFKKVLYLFLFVNTLLMLPMVNSIFGQQGIAGSMGFMWNGTASFLNLLGHPAAYTRPYIAWFFIAGQLVAMVLGYFKVLPKLSAFALFFFTANLFSKGGLFFTGGEVLIDILLFYMIFLTENETLSPVQNVVNNSIYYGLVIQICILYFFSTFFKLYDPNWTSGKALTYVSEIPFYSTDWFYSLAHYSPIASKIATISVLVYQGIFPIVVWIKQVKIPFLIFGVILHLGIAFGMGIFSFGIMMIISYLLFLDSSQIQKLSTKLTFKRNG